MSVEVVIPLVCQDCNPLAIKGPIEFVNLGDTALEFRCAQDAAMHAGQYQAKLIDFYRLVARGFFDGMYELTDPYSLIGERVPIPVDIILAPSAQTAFRLTDERLGLLARYLGEIASDLQAVAAYLQGNTAVTPGGPPSPRIIDIMQPEG